MLGAMQWCQLPYTQATWEDGAALTSEEDQARHFLSPSLTLINKGSPPAAICMSNAQSCTMHSQ